MRSIMSSVGRSSPWVTLVALVVLSVWLPNGVSGEGLGGERRAAIARALETAPFLVGQWIGEEAPVPREAQELLRPNAVLSRTYRRPGGAQLRLLIVHCGDARDMIGHYPPICYPSSGWVPEGSATADVVLRVGGRELPMRAYVFRRIGEHGAEETIRVLDGFVLPDGKATREIGSINRQSERLAVSAQGVAQLQIVTAGRVSGEAIASSAAQLLEGMPEVLEALGIGGGATDEW